MRELVFNIFKSRERYSSELGYRIREAVPLTQAANQEWLAVPKRDVPELVRRYINKMETEESAEWCKCDWATHPDDEGIKKGTCRECGVWQKDPLHEFHQLKFDSGGNMLNHNFKGRRTRRVDDHPTCPVHTREGMVMYFFEWMFTDAARD